MLSVSLLIAAVLPAQPPRAPLKWTGRVQFGPPWEGVPQPFRDLPFPEMEIPGGLKVPAPAVLLLHWHSGSKDGPLFSSEEHNVLEPLLQRGYVLMAIDSYFNGKRLGRGPAGEVESNLENQRDSLFKLNLWFGRTLWGRMLRDELIAIDYLASRPEVDRRRIGASGMSMGSTGAGWRRGRCWP